MPLHQHQKQHPSNLAIDLRIALATVDNQLGALGAPAVRRQVYAWHGLPSYTKLSGGAIHLADDSQLTTALQTPDRATDIVSRLRTRHLCLAFFV